MTWEEAIQWLTDIKENITENWSHDVAIDMAIEALSEKNIARDIATILENEQDMRVVLQNDAVNEDTQTERRVDHDRDWIIGCIKHDGFIKTDRFDKANHIILNALSADAEWIPCSERLPKRDELVLVTYKTTDRIHLCKYLDDGSENPWWSYIDDCCAWNNVVLAWMPLPTPYKGGDDK